MTDIRQDRVNDFLAFMAQHGATAHLRADFSQFDDLTEAEGLEAIARLKAERVQVDRSLNRAQRRALAKGR